MGRGQFGIIQSFKLAACLGIFAIAAAGGLFSQENVKLKVSNQPLTVEQISVYRTVLQLQMEDNKMNVNLAVRTEPLRTEGPSDDQDCAKGYEMEAVSPRKVHRFRETDLTQLLPGRITLVDAEKQRREVKENDPENALHNGASVDDAVRNGFAHGLLTLSEINFDKAHKHAIVSYSFVCGGLCGNGETILLEKVGDEWQSKGHCDSWISRLEMRDAMKGPV